MQKISRDSHLFAIVFNFRGLLISTIESNRSEPQVSASITIYLFCYKNLLMCGWFSPKIIISPIAWNFYRLPDSCYVLKSPCWINQSQLWLYRYILCSVVYLDTNYKWVCMNIKILVPVKLSLKSYGVNFSCLNGLLKFCHVKIDEFLFQSLLQRSYLIVLSKKCLDESVIYNWFSIIRLNMLVVYASTHWKF